MNSSLRSALECASVLLLVAGCGPKDGSADYEAGLKAYELHDFAKAGKLFEKSVAMAPTNIDALVCLARVQLEQGELTAAKKHVEQAAELAPGECDILLIRAQIAWHAKDYAAARKNFSEVASNTKFDPSVRADGWAGVGVVEMTCNNRHLSRIAFLRAIQLDRRNASARYHLALLYRDAFDYKKLALEQMEIFQRLEVSASPRVQRVQRTVIPALKESITRAEAERPGVAKRNSGSCAALLAKAEAAVKKGNHKSARQLYQEALSADPLSYPAALGLAKAWQKTDTTQSGQMKAFESYKTACTLNESAISTYLTAGALAAKLGLHAQAVEIYSRALAASPNSIDAADGLIRALRKAGGQQKAADAYQAYRDSLPKAKRK